MNSLLDEAWRLEPFVPPFRFSAFFSPEDTLLCVCAAESARHQLQPGNAEREETLRITELTSGSGLVGLYLLRADSRSTLLGLDVDAEAIEVASRNAHTLGLTARSRFAESDLWSERTLRLLESEQPQLVICNPPYVPEPPGMSIEIEAGAGAHGTAHLLRSLELARLVQPDALALSWCSLSDPASIVASAENSGYELRDLFVAAIADGEYAGTVHSYLRSLDNCYINEQVDTLAIVAPDGAARFAYLLFAGTFRRHTDNDVNRAAEHVRILCEDFTRNGLRSASEQTTLSAPPFVTHRYVLNRWDELQLRVMLHGEVLPHARTK